MYHMYLAGPMAGLSYEEANEWRAYVTKMMPNTVKTLSPLRNMEKVKRFINSTDNSTFRTDHAIMHRDHNDIMRSDIVFFNLKNAPFCSPGTPIEMGWCYDHKIPTVVVMEEKGNIYDHPMIRESITYRVDTLDEGIHAARSLLLV